MSEFQYSYINVDGKMIPYQQRDISWLHFNYRVLKEAMDEQVPLFERLKFLAIYSNNLEEFFRVRVANNRNLIRLGKKTKRALDFNPEELQEQLISIVNKQQIEFSKLFSKKIVPACRKQGINFINYKKLSPAHELFVDSYFEDYVLPHVQPILLQKKKVKPFFKNGALYLAIHLQDKDDKHNRPEYAVVTIPSDDLPRFIQLPSAGHEKNIIFLDDVIRFRLQNFFPGYKVIESYSMKLSRDAALYIDDEYEGNLVAKIKKGLDKRNVGPASRLAYDRKMPSHMLEFFSSILEITRWDLFKEGKYHNNSDFFSFPNFNLSHLKNKSLKPIPHPTLSNPTDLFTSIKHQDHLIHVPYHSYDSVVRFFEESAADKRVTHIKIVQYRVAKESKIMNALIFAAQQGKHVTVFVEVKARFDEELNIKWAAKLESHGIHVHYSFPGLKVHAKMALVRRKEGRYTRYYCYLSTGNFHEKTVKLYSDIGLFTARKEITKEVVTLFDALEKFEFKSVQFKTLLVGQFNLRSGLEDLIEFEIAEAKNGKKAELILKMNSLQDAAMIRKLYQASKAGVKIRLIVRGICSLVPNLKNWSENIRVISIIDRYLEHTRIFYFHHGGEGRMFAGSADWMKRNLSNRVETLFPILDDSIRGELLDFLEIQWHDTVKSRHVHLTKNNLRRKSKNLVSSQAQIETYYYYKRKK